MRKLRWILPLGLVLIFFLSAFFVVSTETGLKLVQRTVNSAAGKFIHIEAVKGSLADDWSLSNLQLKTTVATIEVDHIHGAWNLYKLLLGRLVISEFTVSGVNVHFLSGSQPPTQENGGSSSGRMLPVPKYLSVKKFLFEKVRLGDDAGEIYTFDRFGGQVHGSDAHLEIGELFLYSENLDFTTAGVITPAQDWKLDIGGKIRFVGYGFHQLNSTFTADGPLEAPHLLMDVSSPVQIKFDGHASHLFSSPAYTLLFTGKDVDLSAFIKHCPQIILHEVHGDTHGDTGGYGGLVTAIGDWGHSTEMHFTSRLSGGMWGIDFDQLEITRKDGKAAASDAKISWRKIFSWGGNFDFSKFDLETVAPALHGKLSAKFTSVGDVNDHGLDASFTIAALDGDFMGRPVAGKGMLYLDEAGIHSDNLTLQSGEVDGTAQLEQGAFSWEGTMPWKVKLKLTDFNPERLYTNLPGRVSGEIEAEGEWTEHGPQGTLAVSEVSGELRGNPLSGGGKINFREDALQSSGLTLESGGAKLTVSGETGTTLALEARFDVDDISMFAPGAEGQLKFAGKIGGTFSSPEWQLSLGGRNISYEAVRLNQLNAALHNDPVQHDRWQAEIQLSDYRIGGISGGKAVLIGTGSQASHQLTLQTSGSFGTLKAAAVGHYVDGQLTGQLTSLDLLSPQYGTWHEKSVANYFYGNEKIGLDDFCFSGGNSEVCFTGSLNLIDNRSWDLSAGIKDISLSWLTRWGGLQYPVTGSVNGQLKASGRGDEVFSAQGRLNFPEADFQLSSDTDTSLHLLFDDASVSVDAENGQVSAALTANGKNGSSIKMAASVAGFRRFSEPLSPLAIGGRIDLANFDLSVLAGISSNMMEPTGRADSSFEISGTIGEPSIQGQLNIGGGGIELPYQGITLEDVNLSLGAEDHGVRVVCTARSGPGKIISKGVIHYSTDGLSGTLAISGDNFLVVDLPEYGIRVNPALKFSFVGTKATVDGTVFVPYGRITPEEITNSVTVSEDVVLVEKNNVLKAAGWPLILNIGVVLGQDVQIDGYGLKGLVNGRLRIKTSPDEQLNGSGEISLKDGTFTIYGRSLDIVRGRLLFTGGAIDNPGVDARAQKKVSDEEAKGQGYTVGVDISGLVQDLQYHLFSDPSMEDTEIVSRMLVGHSFADSNAEEGGLLKKALVTLGVRSSNVLVDGLGSILTVDDFHLEGSRNKEDTSLVLGKRLTEDLYIGYDVNMFSQLGSFRVRYDLKHGFVVETTSSSEATGADLMYSFQR